MSHGKSNDRNKLTALLQEIRNISIVICSTPSTTYNMGKVELIQVMHDRYLSVSLGQ
jgi:hypothetical protein